MFTEEQGRLLLDISRKNIISYLETSSGLDINTDDVIDIDNNSWLNGKGAVFVTLNLSGNLKGCIGSLVAYRSLLKMF